MESDRVSENAPHITRERSISNHLALSLGGGVFAGVGILLTIVVVIYSWEMRKELEQKADEYIVRLSGILVSSIWNFDTKNVETIGREFAHNELVGDIRITDAYGKVLFEAHKSSEKSAFKIAKSREIIYKKQVIGYAEISLSLDKYREYLAWLARLTGLMLIGAVLGIFLATGYLLRIFLRKPLADLYHGMKRLAQGDFSYRFGRARRKEFSGIIRQFREMARKVKAREDDLVEANQVLKEEIAERKRVEAINRALLEISNAVNTTHNLDELYRIIHKALGQIIDTTNFFIALYDRDARSIAFPYYTDTRDREFPDIKDFTETGSLTGGVIMARRPILLRESELAERDGEGRIEGTVPRIWIGAPLLVRDEVVGVMAAQSYSDPERYDEDDLTILASVSGQVAIAIERKRAEAALKESESKFKNLFELSPQGIALTEFDTGSLVDVSREFCRMTRLEKGAVIGKSAIDLGFWDQGARDAAFERLKAHGEIRGMEMSFQLEGGDICHTMMSAKIIRMGDRSLILNTILDVTEYKKALEEKAELQERLTRSKKMEALGILAGGVAHDLNNILSGVVSYPDLLLMNLDEESPLRQPITVIRESGLRAAAVVSDLLTLARGVASTRATMSLNPIIGEYLGSPEFSDIQTRYPGVCTKTRPDSSLLNIRCSSFHIRKILMNLVANAYEAIGETGEVIITTENLYLDRTLRVYDEIPPGEYVLLRVSDNGPGIPEKNLHRIFEPFYTRKTMGRSGTGLGLAVVWNTIHDHEGYIDVESSPRGTAFYLYFPVDRKPEANQKPRVNPEVYAGKGESVLVVDDEENQRMIACEMLRQLGYRSDAVGSGEAAVEHVRHHPADLILVDMVMPGGINGRETCQEIARLYPGQKAIIASGYAENAEFRAARQMGVGQYLKKPYTLEAISLAVRTELDRQRCTKRTMG
ncbi:hypothetical protein DENIS_3057 [Desulfonema ishimotonii]|uniref:histidine kinase n=1 Tax=Desulfonema ishimotonii TaxID=45657 RepID=A0A401FYQ6_9BACT|nr:ATP-binding protein [Desulfonema ishimotonii]GBC62094.1 hypothetical protein DENIS_3057 [Desulfonema ishimotonii]